VSYLVKKKQNAGGLFIGLPKEVIEKKGLAPFMVAKFDSEKMCLQNIEKTVKIKINLNKKTIEFFKKYKELCGYSSLDEAVSNAVSRYFGDKEETVYFYPKQFLLQGFEVIEDYEKTIKKGKI